MPVGLLEQTNVYFVLKALRKQILIFSSSVYLESTLEVFLESLKDFTKLVSMNKMQGSPGGKNAIPSKRSRE